MAKYRVQAPDGSVFEVQAPEGASQDEVLAYAQANYGQGRKTYPEAQLGSALQKAHAAGDVAGARQLADQIRWQRAQGAEVGGGDFDDLIPKQRGDFDDLIPQSTDGNATRAPTRRLAEMTARAKFDELKASSPAYAAMSDDEFARRVYQKHYAGQMSYGQYAAKVGLNPPPESNRAGRADFGNVRAGVAFDGAGAKRRDPLEVRAIGGQGHPYTGPLLSGPGAGPSKSDAEIAQIMAQSERGAIRRTPEQAKRDAFRELPAPVRALIGVGSSVGRAGRGANQLYAAAADFIAPQNQSLSGLITGEPTSRYRRALANEVEARNRDAYMQGDLAATLGGVAGDIGLMAAPGGAVARTFGTTGRAAVASNAALAAGYNALQPVAHQESRGQNAAVGAAFGAGGQWVGNALGQVGQRAANAVPELTQALGRRAQAMGIPLHASQVSDSLPVKVAASAGKYLPFSGYGGAAKRQQEAFNRAVGRTFGVDVPKITDDVMRDARQAMSRQFEGIYERNAVPLTEKGVRKLAEIEREASRRLTNDEAQVLRNQLDDILANADDGLLTGQKYQAVRTTLKKAEDKTKLGLAVRDMRQALDDLAADSVGPEDAAALKALRSQWANFRTVENARKQAAGASDDIRPGALWPLIRNGSTKEMRELARMGQTILKDPIADSGTAQRSMIYNVLMGGTSIANPALIPMVGQAALGGATLGRAANSNALAKLLLRENRGLPTSKLAKLLQGANPRVMPAAGAATNRAGLEFEVTGGRPITDDEFEREFGYRP
ncbi:hypothetical protein N800_10210 [Lysobacter daejeonensis GH1-9]|uniref:Uncharacterized protein n=1 Tax=Lysobacter daejeonensis GH1-9 TaxID=1385517 RepID=A0A0A0F0A0_9GAMM|nr:hypothetical protein [Lysobacter daejeonensis]KGM55990.1 hypothetical protein N800_10210 [Lysobacter daejeonensis GH1-9]